MTCRLPGCGRDSLGQFQTRGGGHVTMCQRHYRRKAAILPGVNWWWEAYVAILGIVLLGILGAVAYDWWRTRPDATDQSEATSDA